MLWPDFSFTDMVHAVWVYQRSARHAKRGRRRFRVGRGRDVGWCDARDVSREGSWRTRTENENNANGEKISPSRKNNRDGAAVPVTHHTSVATVDWCGVDHTTKDAASFFVMNRNREIVNETRQDAARLRDAAR